MTEWVSEIVKQPRPPWYQRKLAAVPNYWQKLPEGNDVMHVQYALCAPLTGVYDEATEARVRGIQQAVGLPVTGVVDVRTAQAIDWLNDTKDENG